MYQYVLGKGVPPPFSLCLPHIQTSLPLSTVRHRSVHHYKDSLVIVTTEEPHDGSTFLQLLSDSMVGILSFMYMYSIYSGWHREYGSPQPTSSIVPSILSL